MKFYAFRGDFDYEYVEEVGSREEIVGWCPIYGRQHSAILKYKEGEEAILTVNLPSSNVPDFMRICAHVQIITDKVATIFREHGLKGYELKPVRINKIKRARKSLNSIPKLWEFVVTGFCGMAPPETGIKMIYKCNACNLIRYSTWSNRSVFIEPNQWDGSDFFTVYPMGYVFITERVKKIIEENNLKGCTIVPLEEIEIVSGVFIGDPSYMPYGKSFGEPLGIYVPLEELLERAIQLGENDTWPPGLGQKGRKNEWDIEWRDFLYDFAFGENPGGILSKEILLEKLESMLKKYTHPQAIKDIKEKIDEIKKINF